LSRSLRFCLITTFYPPHAFGGDAILVQQLAHLLADQGHHVEVIHCQDSFELLRPRGTQTLACDQHPGVTVHSLQNSLGPLSPMLTHTSGRPLLKRKAIEKVLDRGFDVIHYHNVSLVGGPGLLELGQGLKLYTSHEYWLHCPTHLLLKWGREPCHSRSCFLCCISQARPPQLWRYTDLMRRCCEHVDLFCYPTEFGKERHLAAGLPGPVDILPNFVPDCATEPRSREGFLYIGRLEEMKGVQDLIPVFERLPQCHLRIIGQGSLKSKFLRLTENLPNVELIGYTDPAELPALVAACKAVLIPSRCFELLPLVLLEALCQSTPVVVSPMGELPRIAQCSQAGMVAQDTETWMEAITLLDSDKELHGTLSENARAYYLANYTPEAHLSHYLSIVWAGLGDAKPDMAGSVPLSPNLTS
jgi:glycosyltransferase involved in cell wall biosynthesis